MKNVCSYICIIIFSLYVQKGHQLGRMYLSVEGKVEGTVDFIHAVPDPVSLSTILTPSMTRLGSGLKGCLLLNTWNYQSCKYLAPYTSISCQSTGGYSSKFVFVCLFMHCLTTLSVIRVILCRVVGLVTSDVVIKRPL